MLLLTVATAHHKDNKRAISMTSSGKSLHDPVSMYEDESMASLKEKLIRAEEVEILIFNCTYVASCIATVYIAMCTELTTYMCVYVCAQYLLNFG